MNEFPKLFIPGPTHVSDDVLEILAICGLKYYGKMKRNNIGG